jgi:hypothetical protein
MRIYKSTIYTFKVVLLNMLSSEFVILTSPLENEEEIQGVFLLNTNLLVHGSHTWVQYSLQGDLQSRHEGAEFISAAFANVSFHVITALKSC